jgi:hypothetical protein
MEGGKEGAPLSGIPGVVTITCRFSWRSGHPKPWGLGHPRSRVGATEHVLGEGRRRGRLCGCLGCVQLAHVRCVQRISCLLPTEDYFGE